MTDDEARASIRIRPMTTDDIDGVLAIESLAGARGWARRTFETELTDPATRRYLVAEDAASEGPVSSPAEESGTEAGAGDRSEDEVVVVGGAALGIEDRGAGGVGRIVGFAGIRLVVDEACITNVAVRPEARRRGVATRLVNGLLDDARRSGVTATTLEVRVGNGSARALYRHLGFTDEGVRPRYYADGEDAVIMWRRDPAEGRG